MEVSDISQLVRNVGRFREVVTILAKYGFADWLHATNADWVRSLLKESRFHELGELTREARIRKAITELGTTYIKLGQVLSTRPDLVGVKIADELSELLTGAPPDAPEVVRAIIKEELGAPANELFAEFEEHPLASASIGQVHKAKLFDGTPVVVKVQHPGIEDRVINDLEIMERLAEMAESYSDELRQYRPVETTANFRRTLLRELDFRGEQRNLDRFRRNFKDDAGVVFPKPFADLSSRHVLTMEFMDGISLSDESAIQSSKLDLEDLARRWAVLFIEMIFRDGWYHADPHPGNLMVLVQPAAGVDPDNAEDWTTSAAQSSAPADVQIGVLDGGMVGQLDESLREDIERALVAIVHSDPDTVTDIIMRRGSTPDDLNTAELGLEVEDFIEAFGHQPLDQFDLSGCLNGIIDIIRRHKIVLPSKIAMLLKVLIMLEGTAQQLSPSFNLAEVIEPFGRKSVMDRFSPQRLFRRASSRYRDWDNLLEIFPKDAADILHRMKKGSFDVHLSHRRMETTVNRLVLGILTAALFIGSTSVLSLDVPPLAWGVSIPGAMGCVTALWLGAALIRAIRKSGNI